MREEAVRIFGFIVVGLVIALGILAVFQMLSVSPLWGEAGAAWVQAIGSIAAIIAAFLLGERQAVRALEAIRITEEFAVTRKNRAIMGIADATVGFARKCAPIFPVDGFGFMNVVFGQLEGPMPHLIAALEAIPVHELGRWDSVASFIELKTNMGYLELAVTKAITHMNAHGYGEENGWIRFDTSAIRLNCEMIERHVGRLEISLSNRDPE